VTLVFLVLGSRQLQILVDFARRIFERIPDVAG
jgi:flagellar biosynthesis protein FliQ